MGLVGKPERTKTTADRAISSFSLFKQWPLAD